MPLKFSMPDRAVPITTADGKTMSLEWYIAISSIVQQLGGPAVIPGGSAITDAVIIEAIDDARNSSDSVPLLSSSMKDAAIFAAIDNSYEFGDLIPTLSSHVRNSELLEAFDGIDIASTQIPSLIQSNKNLSIDFAISIQDGIDAINQAKIALQSAIIEQATMLDVIRSMASQDASHVDIRGGSIDGTIIGSRTPAVATVTTLNKLIFTQPATGATYTLTDGKIFTVSNSIALVGTDSTTMTFPTTSATIARTDLAQTFSGTQTFGAIVASSESFSGNLTMTGVIGSNRYYITDETNTGTGKIIMQAGGGSGAYGAAINLYANAHATKPGDVAACISNGSGGSFRVNSDGLDAGTNYLKVNATGTLVTNQFACNGKALGAAQASGGTLAGVIAGLVAIGLFAS